MGGTLHKFSYSSWKIGKNCKGLLFLPHSVYICTVSGNESEDSCRRNTWRRLYNGYRCLSFYSAAALLAMQSAVIATTIPSVRPSVTRWYSIKTNEDRIMRSSAWGSKNTSFLIPTMVGGDIPFHLKFALKVTHALRTYLLITSQP